MAINSYSIRPPARPVSKSYVPVGGVQYSVKTGDSWVALAQPLTMSPWDLIRYNFPGLPADVQAATREVNWYLQEYVGCTKVTGDGRNYEFSTGDNPGKIWIPRAAGPAPTPAAPSPDELARKQVLAALRDPAVGRMNFGVGRVFIIAYDYERVAKAIESGIITVHVDSRLAPHMAEYWSGQGSTALDKANSFAVPPGGSDESLLIHEATHAIFDIQNRPSYTAESEGLAYVAQALFSRIKYGPSARYIVSADPAHVMSWIAWQAIFDQASMLAEILINAKPPYVTEDQAKVLYWAIGNTITYINQGSNTSYDGVPGA
jgi:hypothetical protein